MFFVGSHVQVRGDGSLGTVTKIASARQLLTVKTLDGQILRLRANDVRPLDAFEWRLLCSQMTAAQQDTVTERRA